jgi:hypothetical protein
VALADRGAGARGRLWVAVQPVLVAARDEQCLDLEGELGRVTPGITRVLVTGHSRSDHHHNEGPSAPAAAS